MASREKDIVQRAVVKRSCEKGKLVSDVTKRLTISGGL